MGGHESSLKVLNFHSKKYIKEQSWCSNTFSCKNCVTEVENVGTEIKRATPIPRGDIKSMIQEQKNLKACSSLSQTTLPATSHNYTIFASDEKKLEFKSALKLENRMQKLKEVAKTAPKLELRVLSSAFLEKGEVLTLNALGLEQDKSLRKANDGFTYFGCKKSIKKANKNSNTKSIFGNNDKLSAQMGATGASLDEVDDSKYQSFAQKEIVNDFIIPTKNEEEKEKHRGRQFQIYYDIDSQTYKVKDLGIGYGAFVKLSKPLILKDNFLLNMGESYIVANLVKPQDDLIGIVGVNKVPLKLRLKIFSVIKADQPDVYCCQNENQEVVIGRTPNCDIRIDDKLISKFQATIKYDGQHWVLTDGYDGKESTNGTWLYLNEDYEIENGMIFKSNQTFFEAILLR